MYEKNIFFFRFEVVVPPNLAHYNYLGESLRKTVVAGSPEVKVEQNFEGFFTF